MVNAAAPVFFTVIVWALVPEPTWVPAKLKLAGLSERAGKPVAVPLRETECGDPGALSVKTTVALRAPAAVGLKVAETVQLAPAARLAPQVVVAGKSPLLPLSRMLEMVSAAAPVFFTVTVWTALAEPTLVAAKLKLVGLNEMAGVPVPVPLRETECGDPGALSVKTTAALRAPAAVGLKVTEIVQLAPAARLAPQVVVSGKSPLLPVSPMLEMVSAAAPVFFSVIVWAALAEPTLVSAKLKLVGLKETADVPVPVPLRGTVCGDPAALSVTATAALRAPAAVGLKVTEIVQLAPAARLALQVVVAGKSP
jgi:hypothetical protein